MQKNRNESIDFLRGLGIIAMIFIHTSYYFLWQSWVVPLWEYAQFAVPVFVFCSGYLFYAKGYGGQGIGFSFSYFKKRAIRLLKPYYIFLIFFIPLIWWKDHTVITPNYLLKSILVWNGGAEINWLVMLFLQFIFVMPFIQWSYFKNKFLFYSYAILSVLASIIFVFYKFPYQYQWIMWLTWSVILLFAFYFVKYVNKFGFRIYSFIISGTLFGIVYFILSFRHISLSFYDNKYPPNFYFLSYGIFSILVLYYFEKLNTFKIIHKIIHFFSIYSYSLFFVHYLILTFLQTYLHEMHFTVWSFTGVVLGLTVIVQLTINKFFSRSG